MTEPDYERPGTERLKEREEFFNNFSSGFYEKTWVIEFSPDPDFKKGSVFGRLDIVNGITSIAIADGSAWAEGTIFRKKNNRNDTGGKLLTVVYPRKKINKNGKTFEVIDDKKGASLVDVQGNRSYQYTSRTRMTQEATQ